MEAIEISPNEARRFALRTLGLTTPFPDVAAALETLGFIQLDPINVCGRMHDLILRNRVAGYAEGDLLRHVHAIAPAPRVAFEHYLPGRGTLAVFPIGAWAMIDAALRARRALGGGWAARRLSPKHEKIAQRMVEEIRERGPLTSDDFEHEGSSLTGWGTPGRLVKNILEVLFHRGDVLIADRRGFRRVYDLPERVIPLAARNAAPVSQGELVRWLVVVALRQRRLVALKRKELPLVDDLVRAVRIDRGPVLHCLREDEPHLGGAGHSATQSDQVRLLAPLDPLIYDRAVTRRVWDFDYTWEVYTPPAKRVRGYYALPVLSRGGIVGHVEPKADRQAGRLAVVSRRVQRGHVTSSAVRELAEFLRLRA